MHWRPCKSRSFAALLAVVLVVGCGESDEEAYFDPVTMPPDSGVTVPHRDDDPAAQTAIVDYHGDAVGVDCATCHSVKEPDYRNAVGADLDEFHQGLHVAHGDLSCLSCHDASDYGQLRRSDGSAVSFQNPMNLCAQCHGPQARDYRAGSHGGMSGYWDGERGPQLRNSCLHCHDAHAPAFPKLTPLPAPPDAGGHGGDHE